MSASLPRGALQEIPYTRIRLAKENVRSPKHARDVDELAESIARVGLLQPVVVATNGTLFELIVGQRRFNAITKLRELRKWRTDDLVPALVMGPLDADQRVLASLTENLERAPLSFKETIKAVRRLLDSLGTVKKVAKALGVTPPTVYRYVEMASLPQPVADLVDERRISQADARRAVAAAGGDEAKAVRLASALPGLRANQRTKIVALSESNPGATAAELIREASTAERDYRVTIILPGRLWKDLLEVSNEMRLDMASTAARAVSEWLSAQRPKR